MGKEQLSLNAMILILDSENEFKAKFSRDVIAYSV